MSNSPENIAFGKRLVRTITITNDRFKRNGYKTAKAEFGWYNPRRYIVMNQARRFGNICQIAGWDGWASDCNCAVCQKARAKEKES